MTAAPAPQPTLDLSGTTENRSLQNESRTGERFSLGTGKLRHSVRLGDVAIESWVATDTAGLPEDPTVGGPIRLDLKGAWWRAYLAGIQPVSTAGRTGSLRVADLFSGVGGLALGVRQLAAEAGRNTVTEVAVDTDAGALEVYSANHETRIGSVDSAGSLVDFRLKGVNGNTVFVYEPEIVDDQIARAVRDVDLVMAGPPCQGHSNLNNRSRRDDPRNLLYLTVPAFAVAARARAVIIENVPSVLHDRTSVVATTRQLLESAGYTVTEAVLAADAMGWPQSRRRFFMVARRESPPIPFEQVNRLLRDEDREPRSVWWAIGEDRAVTGNPLMDQASDLSSDNQRRIDWLFDNDAYDLGLAERPVCHQDGTTYQSIYGRMVRDKPAGTITTGFMTPGRGRFVHPTQRRTLTPGEAARLQGFPKNYRFATNPGHPPSRAQLSKWIGNAVPMPLGYGAALAALGPDVAT